MRLIGYPCRVLSNPFHSLLIKTHQLSNLSSIPTKMQSNPTASKRPTCSNCSKPLRLCLCTRILNPAGIDNKVSVVILQHSLEQKHPLNSARIVKLGLRNIAIYCVFDVNFGAKFLIRVLEPGLGRVSSERLGFCCLEREMRDTQKRKFENLSGFGEDTVNVVCDKNLRVKKCDFSDSFNEKVSDRNELVLDEKFDVGNEQVLIERVDAQNVLQASNEVVIFASIKKFGVITDLDYKFLAEDCNFERSDFDRILGSGKVINALRSGFAVKKLQTRQLDNSSGLEEYEEFDIVVPGGTVLLFPSDNAVRIDDLKAMNIEVKNLIVLDGTWSKARRMYNENPWLKFLPHLKLDMDQWSLYSEVRRQPKAGCLSTIESIVYTLKAVGDDADGLDNLLDVFESMVGDQRRCKDERLSKVSTR